MSKNKKAELPADNGKPVAWITRGKITMIRADAVMLDDTSIPLYVSPRKQWVGLTDEEMEALFLNEDGVRFARYIESRLKDKNA